MATVTVRNYTVQILLLLLLLRGRLIISAESDAISAVPTLAPSSFKCSDDLVSFSVCLSYVAVPPNNLTDSPPAQCCEDVLSALENGSAICLCYFVRRPNMLGFPINSTKLLSLSYVCSLKDRNLNANFTLESLCSGLAALPPLQSITGASNSLPHHSGANSPPPLSMGSVGEPTGSPTREEPSGSPPIEESNGSPPIEEPADEIPSEPADVLPPEPNFPTKPAKRSLATQTTQRLGMTLLNFLLAVSLLHQLKAINGLA